MKSTELVTNTKISINLVDVEKIKDTLLDTKDIVKIKWKNYINKRWYRKLAIAFNISIKVISEARIVKDDIILYDFTVRSTSPMWRYFESSASCSSNERDFNHLNHDVRATAQTRATNRSISDLIWLWEVSYEEICNNDYEKNKYNKEKINSEINTKFSNHENITQKQKYLLIRLVESKYQDEETRNLLYKKIDSLSKSEARNTIKNLIEEWVEI